MLKTIRRVQPLIDRLAAILALDRLELGVAFVLVFAYLSGAQAHLLPAVYPVTQVTTDPLLLVICLPLLYLLYRRHGDRRLWWWAAATYVGTFFIEAAGVATGAIFGAYHYGATMWAQWLGVPLVIALNWSLLILATNDLAGRFFRQPFVIALVASVLIIAYDFCIEPVAITLDYWQWEAGEIPVQNYLAWGIVALLFSLPLQYLRIRFQHNLLLIYAGAQLVFFLLLNWLF
ncbi:MAG: carotenoid biosynthesis protein [Lewinella sp.]|nr:carotenoid biosynthesis protein [Lewinella sp.]